MRAGQVLGEIDARPVRSPAGSGRWASARRTRRGSRTPRATSTASRSCSSEQLITEAAGDQSGSARRADRGRAAVERGAGQQRRCNLAYTKIVAPIGGRLGLRQVDPGNLVRSGDANGIVVITQMRPISVIFTVPGSRPAGRARDARRRAGAGLSVEAWDRADATKLADGTLQTVDNQIDTTTGTIKLRASFDNADEKLFPNQFVNVRLRVKTLQDATVIPGGGGSARGSFGTFVYVVKPDNTVTIQRICTLGPTENDRVAVSRRVSRPARRSCSKAWTSSPRARRSKSCPRAARRRSPRAADGARPAGAGRRPGAGGQGGGGGAAGSADEHLTHVHPSTGGHGAADGGAAAVGAARVPAAAGVGAAAGRLSDHPGAHLLSGGEP